MTYHASEYGVEMPGLHHAAQAVLPGTDGQSLEHHLCMLLAQATLSMFACSQQTADPTITKLCVPQDKNNVFSHGWRVSISRLRKCLDKLQDFVCRVIIDFCCSFVWMRIWRCYSL